MKKMSLNNLLNLLRTCIVIFVLTILSLFLFSFTINKLNADFLKEYKESMKGLDKAIVYYNSHVFELKKMEMLEPQFVSEAFGGVEVINDSSKLKDAIQESMKSKNVLLMLLMKVGAIDCVHYYDIKQSSYILRQRTMPCNAALLVQIPNIKLVLIMQVNFI